MASSGICYWCGAPATSVEHVPPQGFYAKNGRGDLITVPSCKAHNEDLHQIDERFRALILGGSATPKAIEIFSDAPKRGLLRPERAGLLRDLKRNSEPFILDGKLTTRIAITYEQYAVFFEKIVRGLYFFHFGQPFAGSLVCVCSHIRPDIPSPELPSMVELISNFRKNEHRFIEGKKTDDAVFSYKYQRSTDERGTEFELVAKFYDEMSLFAGGFAPIAGSKE